jgi:1-phosphofructokinase
MFTITNGGLFMIYTCTLNPSVDYTVYLDQFVEGTLNRSRKEDYRPGGKGINVSMLLNHHQVKRELLGFIGGFTGQYITNHLKQYPHLTCSFTETFGQTRINVKLKGQVETEINGNGPEVTHDQCQNLLQKVSQITKNDVFILSGSVPHSIKRPIYQEISEIVHQKKALFIVDASKECLRQTLPYKPFLIKPNRVELEELFNVTINSDEAIIHYAKELQKLGAQQVLVSLGNQGSVLVSDSIMTKAIIPKGQVMNTVGAGDSMVAGFIYHYLNNQSLQETHRYASACGCATAYSNGIASMDEIHALLHMTQIEKMK